MSGRSRPSIASCSSGARRATAILLISEELDEILALADRVDVMYEGRIVGSFSAADADIHEIGLLMTGGGAAAGEPVATASGAGGPATSP